MLFDVVTAFAGTLHSGHCCNHSRSSTWCLPGRVVLHESALSHQVGAEVTPSLETFAVLFFVSLGMLVNPLYVLFHAAEVLLVILIIVVGKYVLTLLQGVLFPRPGRTTPVVATGRSQIGDFSFMPGAAAVTLGVLKQEQ